MNKQLTHEFRLPDPVLLEPIRDPRLELELMRRRLGQLSEANQTLQQQLVRQQSMPGLPRRPRYWAVRQYPWSFRVASMAVWAIALLVMGLVMALLVEGTFGWIEAFEGTRALFCDLVKPLLLVFLGLGLMVTLRDQLTAPGRKGL
jgi:hypothetical protein